MHTAALSSDDIDTKECLQIAILGKLNADGISIFLVSLYISPSHCVLLSTRAMYTSYSVRAPLSASLQHALTASESSLTGYVCTYLHRYSMH